MKSDEMQYCTSRMPLSHHQESWNL